MTTSSETSHRKSAESRAGGHERPVTKHLMEPELFKEFCDEFTREVNRLRIERGADLEGWRRELERTDRELDKAIDAIPQGVRR